MARQPHDVIAHPVSVMVNQAGAARQVVRSSPPQAEESLLNVEETGREEIRCMTAAIETGSVRSTASLAAAISSVTTRLFLADAFVVPLVDHAASGLIGDLDVGTPVEHEQHGRSRDARHGGYVSACRTPGHRRGVLLRSLHPIAAHPDLTRRRPLWRFDANSPSTRVMCVSNAYQQTLSRPLVKSAPSVDAKPRSFHR